MRLEREEVYAIKRAAAHAFGADAVVRLFGSRADDTRRGGDIDLHIETGPAIDEWTARGRFEDNLFARIDEQKVDVTVRNREAPMKGIDVIAYRDGIVL